MDGHSDSKSATDQRTDDFRTMAPRDFRMLVRQGFWRKPTAGCCEGHTQLNLVVLPEALADDFREFCLRNPKPCPLIETTRPGQFEAPQLAPGSDIRRDLPGYKLFKDGGVTLCNDLTSFWRDDFVSFLIGCSFTFESALLEKGIPVRHIELSRNVPMYLTNIPCQSAGPFQGMMVVSMRPIPEHLVSAAERITNHYPDVHGGPVHSGDPAELGIRDLEQPDFGDSVPLYPGEVPVFWACGVTPQVALMNAAPAMAITHAPGFMFVSDRQDKDFFRD